MPSPSLPLVFLLCPFRGLSFVQRQHVASVVDPLRAELLAQGWVPVGLGEWADHPLVSSLKEDDQRLWRDCVRSLVLQCDRVVRVTVAGVAQDELAEWVQDWAPKHAIAVEQRLLG